MLGLKNKETLNRQKLSSVASFRPSLTLIALSRYSCSLSAFPPLSIGALS